MTVEKVYKVRTGKRKPILSVRIQKVLPKIYGAVQDGDYIRAMRQLSYYMGREYPQHEKHLQPMRGILYRLYELDAFLSPEGRPYILALYREMQKRLEPYMSEQDKAIFREILPYHNAASEISKVEPTGGHHEKTPGMS